jgi:hypothetical protein
VTASEFTVQELRLAFKYGDKYSSFLTVVRKANTLNVTENGLLWRTLLDVSDVHFDYPANGNVHYTVRKDKVYTVHVFSKHTTITCYSASHKPADLPDYNAISQATQPLKLMVREGPPLNEFAPEDLYVFPTTALVVESANMMLQFGDKAPKAKYGDPIDLSYRDGDIINIHIFLAGSTAVAENMKFDILPNTAILR